MSWEESIEEAHERKLLRYEQLLAEVRERGYGCKLVQFEYDCRCFSAACLKSILKYRGIQKQNKVIMTCGEKALEGCAWIIRVFVSSRVQLLKVTT